MDPTLAVGVEGYERSADPRQGHRHYLGGAVVLWVAWLAAVAVGATLGARLPAALHLELVVPLFLAGEVATRVTTRAADPRAPLVAVVAAAVLYPVPLHLGTRRWRSRPGPSPACTPRTPKAQTMSAWIVVVVAGAGTYLLRISMLVVAARSGVPAVIERAARFAVPIAFAALAATSLAGLVADTGTAAVAAVLAVVGRCASSPAGPVRPAPPSSPACRPCGCWRRSADDRSMTPDQVAIVQRTARWSSGRATASPAPSTTTSSSAGRRPAACSPRISTRNGAGCSRRSCASSRRPPTCPSLPRAGAGARPAPPGLRRARRRLPVRR